MKKKIAKIFKALQFPMMISQNHLYVFLRLHVETRKSLCNVFNEDRATKENVFFTN